MARTDLPPLNWLRAFEASARHLSFTGAAAELNMTQSAVSQQIKTLEAHLGRLLFHRRPRRLELTEAGKAYLPAVQEAFATLAHGTRAIAGPEAGQLLQVQANMGFSVLWLAPRLPRLMAAHPWLRLNITTAIWEPERTAARADVEIRLGRTPGEGVRAERLTRDRYYPVAAPGFAVELDRLGEVPLFDCADMLCGWEGWFAGQGLEFPRGRRVSYASTYALTLAAAEAGAGVALAHDTVARHKLETGRLVRPFTHAGEMEESYFLIAPDRASASPAVIAFTDWLRAEMKGPGP
ncbi:LysR family transcriptional regulator [Maritimibacter sp. 55A14]|uniref:LysR substrate-binding domain-containing protein n=1 Tax=Maritimibacter sp. 55A14 TaxID=2174844 RepID=UPI000D615DEF|nr:LysR substrate-binding domain-containing protein [Maritimibacter sp. 55A14]PWE32658.1 LysR family transcriptional regulator [Maritimibacter sp. 55A14]